MTNPAIIVRTALEEASALIAKLELEWCVDHTLYDGRPVAAWCEQLQQALVALPLIEADALEKAAKVADGVAFKEYEAYRQLINEGDEEKALRYLNYTTVAKVIAAGIRALKQEPSK